MRKLIAGAALTTMAMTASAQNVYDLQYLNKSGEWFGRSALESSTQEYKLTPNDTEVKQMALRQDIWYGLTETTTLQFGAGYLISEKDETTGSTTDERSGLEDFRLGVKHRFMNEGGRMFDVVAYVATGLGDAENGNANDDGNGYSGRTDFGIALDYGMRKDDFQWNLVLNADFRGSQKRYDATNTSTLDSEVDSTTDFGLTYNALWSLSEQFALQASAFLEMIGERTLNGAGVDSYTRYGVGATAFYNNSNALSWFLGLNYAIGADADTLPDATTKREDQAILAWNLGAVYKF